MMKQTIITVFSFFFCMEYMFAEPIGEAKAMSIANSFINNLHPTSIHRVRATAEKFIKQELPAKWKDEYDPFFIFNSDESFVIVSNESEYGPILAYSDKNVFDVSNIAPAAQHLLSFYMEQIKKVKSGIARVPFKETSSFANGKLLNTANFGQNGMFWWNACPTVNGTHCYAGCGPAAMAIIMKYYGWPKSGEGYNSIYFNDHTYYVDFSAQNYQWGIIPTESPYSVTWSTDAQSEVAKILYHCGVASNISYGTSGSSVNILPLGNIMADNFKFTVPSSSLFGTTYRGLELRSHFSNSEWSELLKREIDNNRPCIVTGESNNSVHIFVCDGYDSSGLFHFNLGWSGISNGYYSIDGVGNDTYSLTFAIVGLYPNSSYNPNTDEYNEKEDDTIPNINGHEYVDLGLPSGRLWAKSNYGASSESDYGIYVDWPSRSIIQSVWGKEWSTPTSADMKELLNQCTFSWGYNSSSVYGCTIKGTNGNSIFLPAAGFNIMESSQLIGQSIFYWSDNEYESGFAGSLSGSADNGINANTTYNYSFVTMPIRPVAEKKGENTDPEGDISQEYVDLALPSGNLWAKANIGAKTEYDYGSKFAFGETTTKDKYMENSYRWLNQSSYEYTKYTIDGINADGKTILESADDAATKNLGSIWKTPTKSDFRELKNYCNSKWETVNGVSGRRFTGANGNSIFMPAAGFTYWYNEYKNELGYYMTSDVWSNEQFWLFHFSDSNVSPNMMNVKYQGYSVRAITNKKYTGINPIFTESDDTESVYDLKGTKKEYMTKGLNIVRQKNGKVKKIIVK